MGMFYRTIRMIEHGIKPVYVFDGKPPEMKSGEVCDRVRWELSIFPIFVSNNNIITLLTLALTLTLLYQHVSFPSLINAIVN